MSDKDSIFEALTVLAKQCRDLEARLAHQEDINRDHHARLGAHAMLIEHCRPRLAPHPVWRGEREAA